MCYLLSKLSCEVEWDSAKVGVAKEIVQIVGQELEDEAQVVPPHEVVLQLDHVELVARVGPVHQLEQTDLNLSLVQKRFLVLDDFDGHVAGLLVVVSLDNL